MNINGMVFVGITLYIAIIIGLSVLVYYLLKKAIKNGLVEAYEEIQKLAEAKQEKR